MHPLLIGGELLVMAIVLHPAPNLTQQGSRLRIFGADLLPDLACELLFGKFGPFPHRRANDERAGEQK